LLRFFDQIRFYPVSADELLEFRADFLHGRTQVRISDEMFRLRDYRRFLADNMPSTLAHKARQQAAFEAERGRWQATGQADYSAEPLDSHDELDFEGLPADCVAVSSPVAGSVWRIRSAQGQSVKAGDTLVLVESMKMEVPVTAPVDGIVVELRCAEGRAVLFAQTLVVLSLKDKRAVA
jgi:urea carboxylase